MAQVEVITKDDIIEVLTNQWLTKPEMFKRLPPIREQSTVKVINDYLETLIKKGIVKKKLVNGRICYGIFKTSDKQKETKHQRIDKIMEQKSTAKKPESRVKIGKTIYIPEPEKKVKKGTRTAPKRSTKKASKYTGSLKKEDIHKTRTTTKKSGIEQKVVKKPIKEIEKDKKITKDIESKGVKESKEFKESREPKSSSKDVRTKQEKGEAKDEVISKAKQKIKTEKESIPVDKPIKSEKEDIVSTKKAQVDISEKDTALKKERTDLEKAVKITKKDKKSLESAQVAIEEKEIGIEKEVSIKEPQKVKTKKVKKSGILPTRQEVLRKKEEIGVERSYQQQSPAEFFKKNKAIAGFDNDQKAVYTIVRELIENSIDAAETIRRPPDIFMMLEYLSDNVYKITIKDNGSGVPDEEIPKCFGVLLYGSKYVRIQGRGHFGMGGKMAILYGQISTLEPVEVKSSVNGKEIYYYKMRIDIKNNEPIIEAYEVLPNPDNWVGTQISFKFKGDYPRVRKKILEYLDKTAIITPHAQIEYIEPKDERCEKCRSDRVRVFGNVMYCRDCFNKFIHKMYISDKFTLKKILSNRISGIDKSTFKKFEDALSEYINLDVDAIDDNDLRKIYNKIEDVMGYPIGITKDDIVPKIFKYLLRLLRKYSELSKKYENIKKISKKERAELSQLFESLKALFKYIGGKSYPITALTTKNIRDLLEKEKKFLVRSKNFNSFLLDIISGLGKKTLEKVEKDYGTSFKIDIYEADEKIDLEKLHNILVQNLTSGQVNIRDLTFSEFKHIIEEASNEKIKHIANLKKGMLDYVKKDAFLSQKEPYKFISKEINKCPYCDSENIVEIGTWRQCQVSSCQHNYLSIYRHIYRRGTTELPPNPTPSLPHPHGIDADSLLEMIKAELSEFYLTYEPSGNYSMRRLLLKRIRGVGKETINKIEDMIDESLDKDADKFENIEQLYNAIESAVGYSIGRPIAKKTSYNINDLSFEKFKEIIEKIKAEKKEDFDFDKVLKNLINGLNSKLLNEIKSTLNLNKTDNIPDNFDLNKLYEALSSKVPPNVKINVKELTIDKLKELIEEVKREKQKEFRNASPNFYTFMNKRFQRTGKKTIENFCKFVRDKGKLELYPDTLLMDLDKKAIVKITYMLQEFPFQRPDASCLAPIGEELFLKGIMKEIDPEWAATIQRPPEVCEGHPFIVEVGLAYGGKIDSSEDFLHRFANRIPLLYESSMGVCATAVKKINWKHYKLDPSKMPIHIFIHIVSTKIPWGRFGKEYIANKPEIRNEIDLGIRYLARQLQTYLSKLKKRESSKKRINKLKIFGNVIVEPLAELVEMSPLEVYKIINNYLINQGTKRTKSKNPYKNFAGFFEDLKYFSTYDLKFLNNLIKSNAK